MKKPARLLILLAAILLLSTLIVLPRVIAAKRLRESSAAPPSATPTLNASRSQEQKPEIVVGASVRNDTSEPLRDMKQLPIERKREHEANENPRVANGHKDSADPVVQRSIAAGNLATPNMPSATLNFDGIPFPGVACNCAPPDTNGEVGSTQYVQMVNEGFQVFDKASGTSSLGPSGLPTR